MRNKALILLLLLLGIPMLGSGQIKLDGTFDAGKSVVSSGPFLRLAALPEYQYKNYRIASGIQWTFSSTERKALSGWFVSGSADFAIKNFPLSADVFFRQNAYTELTKETNFGFILAHSFEHIDLHFGYHMRTYSLDRDYVEENFSGENPDVHIWEYRNFMYRGSFRLNELSAPWNLSISLTNYDDFLIQQETNPMVFIKGYYKITASLKILAELWYQGAGMLNLHANHYGYYFRTGLEWQIDW